jgi:catechol 2,3-dioxygenase-like lactoylglutathione lyase family enzyme
VIKRTTVIVRDLDRALEFYRDVVGLTVWYDREIEFSGGGFPGTARGDRCRLVIVEARDPQIGKIGLLQYLAPVVAPPPVDLTFLGPGRVVFVGADGRPKWMRRLCCFDPDGNFRFFSRFRGDLGTHGRHC